MLSPLLSLQKSHSRPRKRWTGIIFHRKNLYSIGVLGLVILNEETSTVRLVHKSLQDYLQRQYQDGKIFQNGHSEIAYTCLKYMYFIDDDPELTGTEYANAEFCEDLDDETSCRLREDFFSGLPLEVHHMKSRLNRFSFLPYALPNWGHHARKQTTPTVDNLILGLFSNRTGVGCISTHLNSMALSYYPILEAVPLWIRYPGWSRDGP
jgi:hypothetical protein